MGSKDQAASEPGLLEWEPEPLKNAAPGPGPRPLRSPLLGPSPARTPLPVHRVPALAFAHAHPLPDHLGQGAPQPPCVVVSPSRLVSRQGLG